MDPADFVRRNTAIAAPPLVPEIRLHLATEVTPIWQATEESLARGAVPPPFWAFAWAGGQALARYLLDHPETVAGRAVLDFGAGSGLVAIAAAKAGAAAVTAAEIDPFAAAAIAVNAALNGVAIEVVTTDLSDGDNAVLEVRHRGRRLLRAADGGTRDALAAAPRRPRQHGPARRSRPRLFAGRRACASWRATWCRPATNSKTARRCDAFVWQVLPR